MVAMAVAAAVAWAVEEMDAAVRVWAREVVAKAAKVAAAAAVAAALAVEAKAAKVAAAAAAAAWAMRVALMAARPDRQSVGCPCE